MPGPMCRRLERQELLFNRMIERYGVDVGRAVRLEHGEVYARARTQCVLCQACGECALWLESECGQAPAFCPNLAFFRDCKPARSS